MIPFGTGTGEMQERLKGLSSFYSNISQREPPDFVEKQKKYIK
jgi:hypothetical protein